MFSRLRSDAEVDGYIRMTCNPDPDHVLRKWIDWWIDKKSGLPIPERAGVKRYFVMLGDEWYWAASKELLLRDPDVIRLLGDPETGRVDTNLIMSFTFIPATLNDNKDMLKANPKYKAALMAMGKVDRERLLGGNWNVRASHGDYFHRNWVQVVDRNQIPANLRCVRYWDRAATKPNSENTNPDWTVGVLMGRCENGYTWVLDMVRFRDTPAVVQSTIVSTADTDNMIRTVRTVLEKDPGQAGKSDAETLAKALGHHDVRIRPATKAKLVRFQPFSAAAENGLIRVVRAPWNDDYFNELEAFDGSGKGKDDIVDSCSGGYLELEDKNSVPTIIMPTGYGISTNTFRI
jgi:predicted phage terminase large subunit-like protein